MFRSQRQPSDAYAFFSSSNTFSSSKRAMTSPSSMIVPHSIDPHAVGLHEIDASEVVMAGQKASERIYNHATV
jgi:hypothetical protein